MKLQHRIPGLEGKTVIFFDGVCDLCNGMVQFVIKRDKDKRFHFASLQSETGRRVLQALPPELKGIDSILLYTNEEVYVESTAAIKIAAMLQGLWASTNALMIIPAGIRNIFYRLIARNRYRWFGKRDLCMVPTPELKARFLD
ncbi:thiol-disulfide oxidoreductase DCC family protein [Polluticoccus soli]|uniref:thiol-disulfide oxidoreductase DCC family protein n=1 Tax=Polluticoccus soli TaxID=3034150 RepID=UPI0023E1744C|nr:thiol-disulfide oxidoreductase DCC family protein [Flavipsychrobacter sp. JY13-12]